LKGFIVKNIFPGHFRPQKSDFDNHWNESIFIVDANVLLNLYRYSEATRKELEKSMEGVKDRIFIPHHAAKEFFKNRLSVTSGQSKEYTSVISSMNEIVKKISSKDRHPFVEQSKLEQLQSLTTEIIESLEEQKNVLLDKLTNDEILDFIEQIFNNNTGSAYEETRYDEIIKLGEQRYDAKVPPGYKDKNKDDDDPLRKYGDLIVWLQTIDYANENNKSVVFITDDKKEDWWLEQAGKTIGPRPELIEEFKKETKQDFWMYSVSRFIQESAARNQEVVSEDVIEEIRKISERLEKVSVTSQDTLPSIEVSQEISTRERKINTGVMVVTLNRDMRYATGTGKFYPVLIDVPNFDINLLESPDNTEDNIHISYGCGTKRNFNVHLKAKQGQLLAGDYVFEYSADCVEEETTEDSLSTEGSLA
jgi:hypothetical protein